MNKRIAGLVLKSISIISSLSNITLTGNVIGVSSASYFAFISILCLVLGGILMLEAGRVEKQSELEEKLFIRDRKGKIRINDFKGTFQQEGGIHAMPAREAIKKFEEYSKDDELKSLYAEVFRDYILAAKKQRDSFPGRAIHPNSPEEMADSFLRLMDPSYKSFIPVIPENPLLVLEEQDEYAGMEGAYNAWNVICLMEKNIPGVRRGLQRSHDSTFKYNGEEIPIYSGSNRPYETDRGAINSALLRIAEQDLRAKRIASVEESERLDILKRSVYGF